MRACVRFARLYDIIEADFYKYILGYTQIIHTNHELVKTIRNIWTAAFDVDSGLILGQKIKSHTGNPFNDYVDGLADLGSAGSPCPWKRTQSTTSLLSDLDAFKRNNNANFMALPAADSFFHTDGLGTP